MNSKSSERATRNRLLANLSPEGLALLLDDLDLRAMRVKDWVIQRDELIAEVAFPLTAVLSTVAKGADGQTVEVATTGHEGMVGVATFLGVDVVSGLDTFAQVKGDALFMRTRIFREHLNSNEELRKLLGLYTQALLIQISQGAACNRMHSAEERCARWLLMTRDRVDADTFDLTQEFLAQMLGVRRGTVTEVASALQNDEIIRYNRGSIEIRDRARLEERSCECYRLIRDEYDRLLPGRREGEDRE